MRGPQEPLGFSSPLPPECYGVKEIIGNPLRDGIKKGVKELIQGPHQCPKLTVLPGFRNTKVSGDKKTRGLIIDKPKEVANFRPTWNHIPYEFMEATVP